MASRRDITVEFIRQLLDYDPQTGILTWKPRTPVLFVAGLYWTAEARCRRWNATYANKPAGGGDDHGYTRVRIPGGYRFRAHRLIWFMVKGTWPIEEIDHRDGDGQNNRFNNLREATSADNSQNRKKRVTNTSGYTGVYWHAKTSKWRVEIAVKGRRISVGLFDRKEEAHAAYLAAKEQHHAFQPIPREGA